MFNFFIENWELVSTLLLFVFEFSLRVIPTSGNWSILHAVIKVFDSVIRNRAKDSPKGRKRSFKIRKSEDYTTTIK